MSKMQQIPKTFFMQSQRDSFRVATGAYYENYFIVAKHLYLSQFNKNNNGTLVNNDPINEVRLINNNLAEFKYHGDNYVYHIESAEIADAIISGAVMPGSKIKGPFKFILRGRRFALVRESSHLYKSILLKDKRRGMSKIRSNDFKVGGIYTTPGDNRFIYLGKVNSYFSEDYNNMEKLTLKTKNKLFMRLQKRSDFPSSLKEFIESEDVGPYLFDFKRNHSFVEKVGDISVSDDVICLVRDLFKKKFKEKVIENTKDNWYVKHGLLYDYRSHCPLINMHDATEKDFKKFDISKYLIMA